MKSKFLQLYNLVMEEITAGRKPIQKVDAMSPKDFIRFLKEFLPYVKNGKVDINDVRITEKIDGQHLELCTVNGEMMFQSSYSETTTWDKVPMKESAYYIFEKYKESFKNIYNKIGSDFRLIGELIWIDKLEETGKVTPVAASYLTSKFGKSGGMVVFDIVHPIEDGKLDLFDSIKEKKICSMIRKLNDEDFIFHFSNSIDRTKHVTFTLDVDKLQALINNPDFNKERFDKKKDAKILEEIEKIKQDVCMQLSQTIDRTKGAFSEEGDLIEGIVVRINNSGNQYGMFSNGYRDLKHKYWDDFGKIKPIWRSFIKAVFGVDLSRVKRDLIPRLENDPQQFKANFERLRPEYLEQMQQAYQVVVNNEAIPHDSKRVQLSMANGLINKLQESDYDTFINKYLISGNEE